GCRRRRSRCSSRPFTSSLAATAISVSCGNRSRPLPAPVRRLAKSTVLLAQQDTQGALDVCEAGIARQPENGAADLQRAMAHATRAELDGALADCDTAILLLAAPSAGHAQKGLFLAAAGLLAEALAEYQRALAADPAFVPASFSRTCALQLAERER